jgi:hypothetical protein
MEDQYRRGASIAIPVNKESEEGVAGIAFRKGNQIDYS